MHWIFGVLDKKLRAKIFKNIASWYLSISNAKVVLGCLGCQGRVCGGKVAENSITNIVERKTFSQSMLLSNTPTGCCSCYYSPILETFILFRIPIGKWECNEKLYEKFQVT